MKTLLQVIGVLFIGLVVLAAFSTYKPSDHPTSSINASKSLVRIDQTSASQYTNDQQYQRWAPSTCSAASLTEIFNAYGYHYTIADILKVEASIGAITPDQGLMRPEGIDQTSVKFGFQTQTLNDPSLDQVLALADAGTPIIVNFPPSTWAGGHVLVVLGSAIVKKVAYVHLADSSKLNMQYMKRATFLHYWRGFTKVVTPTTTATNPPQQAASSPTSVVGAPTITAAFIDQVLDRYNSPAKGRGQALYNYGVQYGIDPAFALAFFQHESTFGTQGVARDTLSLGNLRCIKGYECYKGGFAKFGSWEEGFETWYQLIRYVYVDKWKLTTIDAILQKYSPAADNNNPDQYAKDVARNVALWRAGKVATS